MVKFFVSIFFIFLSVFFAFFQFSHSNKPIEDQMKVLQMVDQFLQSVPSLPRYVEGGYSILGRSPVVDLLLADPLYMPIYAETISGLIKSNAENNNLFSLGTVLLKAGGIPITQFIEEILDSNDVPSQFMESFSKSNAKKFHSYWMAFMAIHREVETVFSVLTKEEKSWIKENYNGFFFGKQGSEADYDFFTTDNSYPLKFFELASRIDLAKLADCARKLSLITDDFYQSREQFSKILLDENFLWEENGLKFIISQKNHTVHNENADFFIDLGGNNTIRNNAGGTEGTRSLALHIDLKGNNTYFGQHFVQGSGFLGVGLLVSCSGNNTYNADSYSQGCGFFGTGFLVNLKGNNRFVLNFAGQSFGLFGFSILWNKEGKNEYLAHQGMAQAATSTMGVAFLIDNQGDNSYVAGESGKGDRYGGIGQGGSSGVRFDPWLNNPSFYGGVSFLYLGGGNNKLKTVWLGQGSAYFLGVGIVVAEGSNDVFEADYDAQGQGLHLASGLVLRKGSYGRFKGGWGSLGVGGDRSVGMFINIGQHNTFEGTDQSVGTSRKPKSLGVFISIGDNNSYIFKNTSNARLQFPQSPKEWSSALFLEVGKGSSFSENVDDYKRGEDMQWGIAGHSLGISTQSVGENPVETIFSKFHAEPQISFPFDLLNGWNDNTSYRPLDYHLENAQKLANEISTANYDRRRQIYETLDLMRFKDRKVAYDLSYLFINPENLDEDIFNYAVLWGLRNKDKVDLQGIKNALESNLFKSEYARKMAVSLLGTFWTPESTHLLKKVMLGDESEEIRYYAALTLAIHSSEIPVAILAEGLRSNSEFVRFAIAKGLQESSNPSALALVVPLFNDESFYVRRAAGLTALSLHDKKGVDVVLETLQYETLDTSDNYGNNIYKQLSNYLGVDFGLDKKEWINWWKKNKDTFQFPK